VLRKLFVDRLRFTPRDDGFVEYAATCSVGKLLEGIVLPKDFTLPKTDLPKTVVAPTGPDRTDRIQVRDFIAR